MILGKIKGELWICGIGITKQITFKILAFWKLVHMVILVWVITIKFYTYTDSSAVSVCAKFCGDTSIKFCDTEKTYFHEIVRNNL